MSEAGRRVVVTGGQVLAGAVAHGLDASGANVIVVADDPPAGWPEDRAVPCAFDSERAVVTSVSEAERLLGGIDQVVHTWLHPSISAKHTFLDVEPDEWIVGCEGSLEGAWWLARQVSAPLQRSGGGSVVFVVPSVALAGAADYSLLATVGEGLRVLAKGCGRQWAVHGITVNTIAAAPHHWLPVEAADALTRAISLSKPAFGTPGDIEGDLVPLVEALADPGMHFLTASTLVADGGLWMGL